MVWVWKNQIEKADSAQWNIAIYPMQEQEPVATETPKQEKDDDEYMHSRNFNTNHATLFCFLTSKFIKTCLCTWF